MQMSSGVTSSVLTAVPAVAGTVATATGNVPFEWSAALLVLVGLSVLVAIAAHLVNIWKATRPEPSVGKQIQDAVDRHENAAKDRNSEQAEQLKQDFARVEKRLEAHDAQFKELWQAVPWTQRRHG